MCIAPRHHVITEVLARRVDTHARREPHVDKESTRECERAFRDLHRYLARVQQQLCPRVAVPQHDRQPRAAHVRVCEHELAEGPLAFVDVHPHRRPSARIVTMYRVRHDVHHNRSDQPRKVPCPHNRACERAFANTEQQRARRRLHHARRCARHTLHHRNLHTLHQPLLCAIQKRSQCHRAVVVHPVQQVLYLLAAAKMQELCKVRERAPEVTVRAVQRSKRVFKRKHLRSTALQLRVPTAHERTLHAPLPQRHHPRKTERRLDYHAKKRYLCHRGLR